MLSALKKFLVCALAAAPILLAPRATAQVQKRLVCGKVVSDNAAARTEVSLYFADDALAPAAVAERDGTFCVENYVRDLSKSTPARLYVAAFCRPDDLTLVNVPFWPRLRTRAKFSGKRITVGPGSTTRVGDTDVQVIYGHVSLRILDRRHRPLLTKPDDWSPLWIRVRDQYGVTVHEAGLSPADIERSVDLKQSRINLALPEGRWILEVALAGVPPGTAKIRRAVRWRRVPGKLNVESGCDPLSVSLSVNQMKRS